MVDIPDSCATVYVPTGISDVDLTPSAAGRTRIDPGQGAPHSSF